MSVFPITVYGLDRSYFTRKLLGLLKYRQIEHVFEAKTLTNRSTLEKNAGSGKIPVIRCADDTWMHDTTPIALWLETKTAERSIIPADPVALVTTRLLEDFFDEWWTRPAVFFRWHHEADRAQIGGAMARQTAELPQYGELPEPAQKMADQVLGFIETWAGKACAAVGATEDQRTEIVSEFSRFLGLLEQHLNRENFLLGARATLADFALYGALKAHFLADPTPKAIVETEAPSLVDYMERVERAANQAAPPAWENPWVMPETLSPIIQYMAMGFHEFLAANKTALVRGDDRLELDSGYGPVAMVPRRYSEWTRVQTASAYHALDPQARAAVRTVLGPLGAVDILD